MVTFVSASIGHAPSGPPIPRPPRRVAQVSCASQTVDGLSARLLESFPMRAEPCPSIIPHRPAYRKPLRREIKGDVLFDSFSRGSYSTDASIYQIEPAGRRRRQVRQVTISPPRSRPPPARKACRCGRAAAARRKCLGRRSTARSSSRGCSKYMQEMVVALDAGARARQGAAGCRHGAAQPRGCASTNCWFPVDMSRPATRATIGGMTANEIPAARVRSATATWCTTCGAIDAILADGTQAHFGEVPGNFGEDVGSPSATGAVAGFATCARAAPPRGLTRSRRASRSCCARVKRPTTST